MIVFAAFTPHTPLLIPTIGGSSQKSMKETVRAMGRIGDDLRASKPDTIVTISAHAGQHEDAFSANLHDRYRVDLRDFGDLATTAEFEPNLSLIDAIQRAVRKVGIPFTLDSDSQLDYGSAVPLVTLRATCRVVPLSFSGKTPKDHFSYGKALKDLFANRPERIAVIASGDLSHALDSHAPAGYHKDGGAFDASVQQAIVQSAPSQLLSIDPSVVENASECGYRPLLILFGIVDQGVSRPEIYSYEHPFGVGYLVAHFRL